MSLFESLVTVFFFINIVIYHCLHEELCQQKGSDIADHHTHA